MSNQERRADPLEDAARKLCEEAGLDPNSRIAHESERGRTMPAWTSFRQKARVNQNKLEAARAQAELEANGPMPQPEQYANAPLTVLGNHEESTIAQMQTCMKVGNVVGGAICADGHLGYAQPVGGVIAYENQISISGVGFDIACGNLAVRLDVPAVEFTHRAAQLLTDIRKVVSFGVGQINDKKVEHKLFDHDELWLASGMNDYKTKAHAQLGTVGSGNHYVDLFADEWGYTWVGVHFGSRGLGHTIATRHLKLAGGKDGINVPPAVVDVSSGVGQSYLAGMRLAGLYAYAGRENVVQRVMEILGNPTVLNRVHNHHNYAWMEPSIEGLKPSWVVRKGATPAFPGQECFVGGSMGDNAVILEGVESEQARRTLYSTVHGAGRNFGRKEAIRRFTREEMDDWLTRKGVTVSGGDLDESPMAYRRLDEVLQHHAESVSIKHTLKPFAVAMAGKNEFDPWKD